MPIYYDKGMEYIVEVLTSDLDFSIAYDFIGLNLGQNLKISYKAPKTELMKTVTVLNFLMNNSLGANFENI